LGGVNPDPEGNPRNPRAAPFLGSCVIKCECKKPMFHVKHQ